MTQGTTHSASEEAVIADTFKEEARLMAMCDQELAPIRSQFPDWWAYFEDLDPDICDRADLFELIATAPTPLVRQYLHGKLSLRMAIAQITGRAFA